MINFPLGRMGKSYSVINIFPKQKTPFFIWSPPYAHTSSGVRTLHLLCHLLNEAGEKAYIVPSGHTGYAINPFLNTPILTVDEQNFYGDNFIAVYSDVVIGNPFNAKHVVRYLLAPRGAYGGDSIFPDTDQIWGALPTIADNVLRIPVSDPVIFYTNQGNRKLYESDCKKINLRLPKKEWDKMFPPDPIRSGSCFYSHKYEMHGNQPLLELTGGSTRLTGSLENLANIMRKSEVCYIYEVTSAMTEAALCGCPVVLVRTPYFNTIDPACMMGNVMWSDGEIVKETDNFTTEYQKFIDDLPNQIDNFVRKTKELL